MCNIPETGKAEMTEAFTIGGDLLGSIHQGNSES